MVSVIPLVVIASSDNPVANGIAVDGRGIGVGIAYMVSIVSIAIRRLHDMNVSGWWYLWSNLPIFGLAIDRRRTLQPVRQPIPVVLLADLACLIFGLILLFNPGTKGANQYGESPVDIKYAKYRSAGANSYPRRVTEKDTGKLLAVSLLPAAERMGPGGNRANVEARSIGQHGSSKCFVKAGWTLLGAARAGQTDRPCLTATIPSRDRLGQAKPAHFRRCQTTLQRKRMAPACPVCPRGFRRARWSGRRRKMPSQTRLSTKHP